MGSEKVFHIQLIRGLSGCTDRCRATVRALGFRHRGHVVAVPDTRPIRGMMTAITHMIRVVNPPVRIKSTPGFVIETSGTTQPSQATKKGSRRKTEEKAS